jgi:hypothetical protein
MALKVDPRAVDEIVRSIIQLKAELDPTLQRPPKVSKLSVPRTNIAVPMM